MTWDLKTNPSPMPNLKSDCVPATPVRMLSAGVCEGVDFEISSCGHDFRKFSRRESSAVDV